jgi:hypothetical protein
MKMILSLILISVIINGMASREDYYKQLKNGWKNVEMILEKTEEPYQLGKSKSVKLVFINHSSEPVSLFAGSLIDHFDIEVVDELSRSLPMTEWVKAKRRSPRDNSAPASKVPPKERLEMRINLDTYVVFTSPGLFRVTFKAISKSFGGHIKNTSYSITIKVEENKDANQ